MAVSCSVCGGKVAGAVVAFVSFGDTGNLGLVCRECATEIARLIQPAAAGVRVDNGFYTEA